MLIGAYISNWYSRSSRRFHSTVRIQFMAQACLTDAGRCSSQVPGYLENAADFAKSGVQGIYIVAVNDIFCVNAWKEKLASGKPHEIVHFVSDGTGHFTNAMGLLFDASGLLGNHRSKRYVATVNNGTVEQLEVEDDAPNVTVTDAKKVLSGL